jgi:hypothetical protein
LDGLLDGWKVGKAGALLGAYVDVPKSNTTGFSWFVV